MHRRQPLPRLWMMTDERQGEALWTALERLPKGAGVIFRHYGLPAAERRRLFEVVRAVVIRKRLVLLLAGPPALARVWGADGFHGRWRRVAGLICTSPAHDVKELRDAERRGVDLVFISPVYATRSHPGEKPLGPLRFAALARSSRVRVIALGGMDPSRARRLEGFGIYGWAAIDAWSA